MRIFIVETYDFEVWIGLPSSLRDFNFWLADSLRTSWIAETRLLLKSKSSRRWRLCKPSRVETRLPDKFKDLRLMRSETPTEFTSLC